MTWFYGPLAQQNLILPRQQAAGDDLGILVVNGFAVRAKKSLPVVSLGDSECHWLAAFRTKFQDKALVSVRIGKVPDLTVGRRNWIGKACDAGIEASACVLLYPSLLRVHQCCVTSPLR